MAQARAVPWMGVLARLGRTIIKHPFLTIVAVGVAALLIQVWLDQAAKEALEKSPAGVAQAQREDQERSDALDRDLAQGFVKARLRDPESAQFLTVHIVRRDGEKGVCGYVNARNGFGGMTGNEAFAVIGVTVIMANDAYPKDLKRLDHLCYGR
jgi:hypothetical protein